MRKWISTRSLCALVGALVLTLGGSAVSAQDEPPPPCDFLTGGGYITDPQGIQGTRANFAVGGGCKHESFWGHLQYHDKYIDVKIHGISITGYVPDPTDPVNARLICGTGRTKEEDEVTFIVRAKDDDEPGMLDEFDIQVTGAAVYSTFLMPGVFHKLDGGNIQLHKPNQSNSGGTLFNVCPNIGGGDPPE
jgi:hypothetical protein